MLFSTDLDINYVSKKIDEEGRILLLKFKLNSNFFMLCNVYSPVPHSCGDVPLPLSLPTWHLCCPWCLRNYHINRSTINVL